MSDHHPAPAEANFLGWLALALIGVAVLAALVLFLAAAHG